MGRTNAPGGRGKRGPPRPTSGRTVVEPYLASMGVRQLEGLVLTHWDEDHAGSAPDLLRDLPTGFLAFPATDPPRPGLSGRIADLCRRRGVRFLPLSRGSRITLDDLDLEVLNPPDPSSLADENDRSLVFRTALGGYPLVFSEIWKPPERRRCSDPARCDPLSYS